MSRKFVLIDQSIKDSGGHHLEYAKRVLRAAKADGFTTILAVNKSCGEISDTSIDAVEKAFSLSFWENFACNRQAIVTRPRLLLEKLKNKKDDFIYDILFGQIGAAYRLLNQDQKVDRLVERYRTVGEDQKISLGAIVVAAAIVKMRNILIHIKYRSPPLIKISVPTIRFFVRSTKIFFGILLAPFVFVIILLRWRSIAESYHSYSALFADECRQLFRKTDVCGSDIVFVPTLGDIELSGVSLYSRYEDVPVVEWHLLFRRNLFEGQEPSYLAQIESAKATQIAFSEFKRRFITGRAYFYTDTDPLTEQYNLLGVVPFKTLPIPHDESLRKINLGAKPLVVSYIGDAREEKGFQHLPRIVNDIRAAGFDKNDVTFRFQSNFNTTLGDPSVRIAKAELVTLTSSGVDLLEGPFDSDEYANLINTSDIILIPYDENNYYARSSGIFAEALAAGVPTVYPSISWMGREMLPSNQEYWNTIENTFPNTAWRDLICQGAKLSQSVISSSHKDLIFFRYRLVCAAPGRYVRISLNHSANQQSICSALLDLRTVTGLIFLPLKHAGSYQLQLEDASALDSEALPNIESLFAELQCRINSGVNVEYPYQMLSVGYDSGDDISASVIELIANYSHYAAHCAEFAINWRTFHSSMHLVQLLKNRDA